MKTTVLAASLALGLSVFGFGSAANAQPNKVTPGHPSSYKTSLIVQPLVPGPVERVNTTLEDNQTLSSSSPLDDGGYVVLWETANALDIQGYYLQRFDEEGKKVGGEVLLPQAVKVGNGSIAVMTDGSVVIAYVGRRNAQGELVNPREVESGVYIQKFNASGVLTLRETPVVTTRGPGTVFSPPGPVALANGDFVIQWSSTSQPVVPEQGQYFAQRYNAEGYRIGSPMVLPSYDARIGRVEYGVQAALDGGFLFYKVTNDSSGAGCFGAMSQSTATAVVHYDQHMVPMQILAPTHCASVLPLKDGNFMVFQSNDAGPYVQLIDANGALVGPQKPIAARTATRPARLTQFSVRQSLSDGSYVVAWFPGYSGVKAQRYTSKGDPIGEPFNLGLLPQDMLALTDGDALLIGSANQPGAVGVDLYMQRLTNVDQMNDPQKNWKRKQCQAQSKAMKGQERKAFIDRCLAD